MSNNTRQQTYREFFKEELRRVKEKHGHGQCSFAEGVTRKSARRIARNIARQKMRTRLVSSPEAERS